MVVQHPGTYVAEIFDAHCLQHIEGQSLVGNGFIGQEVFYYRMVAARTDKYSLYSRRGVLLYVLSSAAAEASVAKVAS